MPNLPFSGVSVAGVKSGLLSDISSAAKAVGATSVIVTSGLRPPGPSNDVKDSNHITGNALDGFAVIGGKQVPLGKALLPVAGQFGLRSGDVAGFDPKTQGGYDPVHVDDGANVGGVSPTHAVIPQSVFDFIQQGSIKRELDPDAVRAVVSQEGQSGKIGDNGHAFGPFQLNDAGGVITGMFPNKTPEEIQAWAMSPDGLNFALDHIATVAKGLKGSDAVVAIVDGFERPTDKPKEIADAEGALGSVPTAPTDPSANTALPTTPSQIATPQQIAALAPLSMPGYAAVKGIAPKAGVFKPQPPVVLAEPKFASNALLAGLPKPGRAPKAPGGVKPRADSLKLKLPKQSVRKGRSGISPTRKQKAIEPL